MKIRVQRRDFLAGIFSALGFAGTRELVWAQGVSAPPAAKPNLVLGVLSDTHLRRKRAVGERYELPAPSFPTSYFRDALAYFRDQGVDAVVHCGDWAHRGLVCEMRFHADIWYKVFPNNRGKDGRTVEKLFVTGNHDWEGSGYEDFGATIYPDPEDRKRHVLATDMAKNWESIWHEPYVRTWHKCVKGYHFFGEHFEGEYRGMAGKIGAEAGVCSLAGRRPFFVLQHMIPRKNLRKVLGRYPNALALFGHWHRSLTCEQVLSGGAFTMVQCGSLRKNGASGVPGCAFEATEAQLLEAQGEIASRQGMLIKVYDDRIVFCRRDFVSNAPLGPDWVLPLGMKQPHPFAAKELAKRCGVPSFPAGARLEVARTPGGLVVKVPQAQANLRARAYAFDVRVQKADGTKVLRMCRHAVGCNFAPTSKRARQMTVVRIPAVLLPADVPLTVTATPVSALGRRGRALEQKETALSSTMTWSISSSN